MKEYELMVLFDQDLEIDIEKPLKKVDSIITDNAKGKVIKQDIWGKRRLAYPIKKKDYAVYVFYSVELPPEGVAELERVLNITNEVIRYLVTNPVPKVEGLRDDRDRKRPTDKSDDDKADKESSKSSDEKTDSEEK